MFHNLGNKHNYNNYKSVNCEKVVVAHLIKKYSAFNGTQNVHDHIQKSQILDHEF